MEGFSSEKCWYERDVILEKKNGVKYEKSYLRLRNLFPEDVFCEILIEKEDKKKRNACFVALQRFFPTEIVLMISETVTCRRITCHGLIWDIPREIKAVLSNIYEYYLPGFNLGYVFSEPLQKKPEGLKDPKIFFVDGKNFYYYKNLLPELRMEASRFVLQSPFCLIRYSFPLKSPVQDYGTFVIRNGEKWVNVKRMIFDGKVKYFGGKKV